MIAGRLVPTVGVAVLACLGGACAVSDPRDPLVTGPPQEPQQSGEQAETDAVVAARPAGGSVVVVGHRYTGPNQLDNDPQAPMDVIYSGSTDSDVAFLRGASVMGWSYSIDGGFSWHAPGKVYPSGAGGDPVAIIWGDPALAAGFNNRSLVAYASLAVSEPAFDMVTVGTDTEDLLFGWPPNVDRPDFPGPDSFGIVDSVCASLSFDGGITFERPVCKRPEGVGLSGTDQTTVGIDALDRIFVAADDFSNGRLLLFELRYLGLPEAYLAPVPVPPEMEPFSHGPELRRDQEGALWLAGVDDSRRIGLCRVTASGCIFVGVVTENTELFADLPPNVVVPRAIRSGSSTDFGVNRIQVAPGVVAREFVFAYSRRITGQNGDRVVAALTRCHLISLAGGVSCQDIDAWGTILRAGQHLQPNIEFVDKSPQQDGTGADWRYAFYEFGRPDVANGHAQVTLGTLSGALPEAVPPSVSYAPLQAPDPSVCPARYPAIDYWGDYFALVAVPPSSAAGSWRHLAVYSSDEGRGCAPSHPRQGRNLHVVAWSWPN